MVFSEDKNVKVFYKSRYTTILMVSTPNKKTPHLKVTTTNQAIKELNSFLKDKKDWEMSSRKTMENLIK